MREERRERRESREREERTLREQQNSDRAMAGQWQSNGRSVVIRQCKSNFRAVAASLQWHMLLNEPKLLGCFAGIKLIFM